jgi:xanthine dehydrogenase accessory factor
MLEIWNKLASLSSAGSSFVVVTLIGKRGLAPQDPGAKCVVTLEGLAWGTVGGGKVEAKAISWAKQLIQEKNTEPQKLVWNLQHDVGMTCGGEVEFLFEAFYPKSWKIVVFGAGHIAQELVQILSRLEASVACVDTRVEWLERLPKNENIKAVCVESYESYVPLASGDCFFVIVTQGHATDLLVAEKVFQNFPHAPYVGVIGSEIKAKKVRSELKQKMVNDEFVERLRCPMGVFKGKNHPGEIAVSICAELIQVRDRLETSSP